MTTPRDPDEPYADRLREVLRAEGDRVVPEGDGLMRIRERIGERRARNRWLVPIGAAAAVALVAGGIVGGLALTGSDDAKVVTPIESVPVITPSGVPSATPTNGPATTAVTVPVYYLHDTGNGTGVRLYREFHVVQSSGGSKVLPAVEAMLHTPASDSDYTSLWPANTSVRSVSFNADHSVAAIQFSKDVTGPFNGNADAARLTIQQLVWTVTAADNAVTSVIIRVEGEARTTSLFGVDVSKSQARAVSYTVLGAVWILAPTYGQTVRTPVTFSGQATVFEAVVSIEIVRGSTVVKRTTAMATTGGPGRGDWKVTLVLAPGSYVIRAYESSAKDGSVTNLDDKPFTVR